MKNLVKPNEKYLVRNVEKLKESIANNPLVFWGTFICVVENVTSTEYFAQENLSIYKFSTIGGNHRRAAMKTLLEQNKLNQDTLLQ